jgi:hypothetical protein
MKVTTTAPLAMDLFCGLGGWTEGLRAEGVSVIGVDTERHVYDEARYPAQWVIQNVLTLQGSQFKDAALIVASPPCQAYSDRAMPWSRAKPIRREYLDGTRDRQHLTARFDACFRIQREAGEAAGDHIPMVIEHVRGAQAWVGRSRWNFGSFHLWGDVPARMPMPRMRETQTNHAESDGVKFSQSGAAWFDGTPRDKRLGETGPAAYGSTSTARRAASAAMAKIPLGLARHIARAWKP